MENIPILPVITFIIGVAFTIALNVSSNLITPKIDGWLAKRSANVKARSAKQLRNQIEFTASLHSSHQAFGLFKFVSFLSLIFLSTSLLFFGFLTLLEASYAVSQLDIEPHYHILTITFLFFFTSALFVIFFFVVYKVLSITLRVFTFEIYILAAQKRLAELQQIDQQATKPTPPNAGQ